MKIKTKLQILHRVTKKTNTTDNNHKAGCNCIETNNYLPSLNSSLKYSFAIEHENKQETNVR